MRLRVETRASPVGKLTLVTVPGGALCGLAFEHRTPTLWPFLQARFGALEHVDTGGGSAAGAALDEYFAGRLDALERIAVDTGGSPFQQQVWSALRRIPAGATVSYSELARAIERPTGFRAVATANATNPVAIVVPCHRVIHADGSISGYGGGVERKRWLLRHEARHARFTLRAGSAC